MATKQLTFTERTQLHQRLTEVLSHTGEKVVAYIPGYNDHTIATELGITAAQVQHHRQEHFGMLYVKTGIAAPRAATVEEVAIQALRITALELEVARIAAVLKELPLYRAGMLPGWTGSAHKSNGATPHNAEG